MGNQFPHEGTDGPVRGNRGPVTRTGLFSIGGKFGMSESDSPKLLASSWTSQNFPRGSSATSPELLCGFKSNPEVPRHEMQSLRIGLGFPARTIAAGKSAAPSGKLLDFLLQDRHGLLEFFWRS